MNRNLPVLLLLIIFSGYLSSCSLLKRNGKHKHVAKDSVVVVQGEEKAVPHIDTIVTAPPVVKQDTVVKSNDAAMKELIARVTPYWTNRIAYKTFSGKAKIHVETPDAGNDFAAHFRIRKDSVIWVSINLAGISVARVFVTQDSIFLIDYYHKEAKVLPLSQIAKILPSAVDFKSLQNLVIGEPLVGGDITEAKYTGDSLVLKVEDSNYFQNIIYNNADSTMRSELLTTQKPDGPISTAEYKDYEITNGRKLSASRVLHVQNKDALYLLEMNFSKWEFDEQLDYPFSIPKNYR
ncbi:MAG: hypothetical protein JWQ38_2762 [Flavipsychrobacter sp.]|nr:hypothetical protein [Flavipsychrobacter sp.]